ncbi:hypothetical protein COOONC_04880 [Cooperia oncophora]
MEFSSMGFIAKLFRCGDLRYMIHAVALYYQYKPVDWILMDIIRSRYCNPDKTKQDCDKVIRCFVINSGTSQFQHVGKVSSLAGKIQGIRDHTFGTGRSEASSWSNPPAVVNTSMPTNRKYEAQLGYTKIVGIWFTNATEGSYMSIKFTTSLKVTGL